MQHVNDVTLIKAVTEADRDQKLRVGAYCRVSTDSDDQLNSFIAQVRHYNDYIRGQKDMVLVDVYADEGITGTSVKKRDEFNRMVKDSKDGKLDRVLVKSVSRFARNAMECIKYVRLLKSYGTTVFFENDGIDSKTMNHELILYIKSAFAENEAKSASKRVKRSNQMRMETGEFGFVTAPFGYRLQDNTLVPVEEEAKIVREIYKAYLSGMGFGRIVSELNKSDNPIGKPWGKERVRYILFNEKYIGDTLHQKTYTPADKPYCKKIAFTVSFTVSLSA